MNATRTDQFVFPDDVRWDDARQAWNLAGRPAPCRSSRSRPRSTTSSPQCGMPPSAA